MAVPQSRTVFNRFLTQIASSWLIGPIGVLFLQWYGWGSQPLLIAILLALSLAAPIQLLSNEFLATGVTARKFNVSPLQFSAILAATFVAMLAALYLANDVNRSEPFAGAYFWIALLTLGSIWLSYKTCLLYYDAVINRRSDARLSVLVGSVPGLTNLACFVLAAASNERALLITAAIFPAVLQFATITMAHRRLEEQTAEPQEAKAYAALRNGQLAVLASALIAVGMASTFLRDFLAAKRPEHAALVLVALNLMGTLVLAFGRATYLSARRSAARLPIWAFGLSSAAATVLWFWNAAMGAFALLVALQFLVAIVLAVALNRRTELRL